MTATRLGSNSSSAGSVEEFDSNWKQRSEARYNHWTRKRPSNQIQLAFRNHWTLFKEILDGRPAQSCLEVGSGRGSISSYFADAGTRCTLLDTSHTVLRLAAEIYAFNGHHADFVCGDALRLPFEDDSFDVVVSIGLLEHFENIETAMNEQLRVLKPGGTFLGYVVPHRPQNIQKHFNWFNSVLKEIAFLSNTKKKEPPKTDLFRSDMGSARYLRLLEAQPVSDILAFGVYPMPMISHSPEFPFSLLPKPAELTLTCLFELTLWVRRVVLKRHPWICRESLGQAFLVSCRKMAQVPNGRGGQLSVTPNFVTA